MSVTDVCFAVGCSSLGTFSTRVCELVGMSPSSYRKLATEDGAGIPNCLAKQITRPIRNREAVPAPPIQRDRHEPLHSQHLPCADDPDKSLEFYREVLDS
jgi:hypothetical protein